MLTSLYTREEGLKCCRCRLSRFFKKGRKAHNTATTGWLQN